MDVLSPQATIILDFDGTITRRDMGDAICTRFGDPDWREVDRAWIAGEISLVTAQERIWATVRAEPAELMAYVTEAGLIRADFADFCAAAVARGYRLVLASGGFDFYIRALLGPALDRFSTVLFNQAVLVDHGVSLAFPLRDRWGCERCAVCKGRVCDHFRQHGGPVVFVGDGSSDRCAVGRADHLVAVRGSLLALHALATGVSPFEFERFADLMPQLDYWRQPAPV